MTDHHKELKRVRSLKKEKDDLTQFRHHRNRLIGHTVSTEYHQNIPFFFTREMNQLNMVGNYRGASAFLICNGPSLASGRYDLSLLKRPGVITYGMNNGARTVRPNFWTCVDDPKRFLKSIWLDPTITKFVPHAHSEKPLFDNEKWENLRYNDNGKMKDMLVGNCPNVVYFHRNSKFMADRFLWEDSFNWGNHKDYGGGRSVMLPALRILFLLGFRKVYMLGADFKMSEDYTYHFDEQRAPGAVKGNMFTYDRLKSEYFPQLKPHFDQAGFKVYNCTEGSQLDVFPFVKYEDAIEEATGKLGDVNSRTWGLYGKPDERLKHKNEPKTQNKVHLKNISKEVAQAPKYTQILNNSYEQPSNVVNISDIPVNEVTERFLRWKLPEDFSPDGGIKFQPPTSHNDWPYGTNLLDFNQAKSMVEHILDKNVENGGINKKIGNINYVEVNNEPEKSGISISPTDIISRTTTKSHNTSSQSLPKIEKISDIFKETEELTILDDDLTPQVRKKDTKDTKVAKVKLEKVGDKIVKPFPMLSDVKNGVQPARKMTEKVDLGFQNVTINDDGK